MRDRIERILEALETGRVNRRQAASALVGLVGAMAGFDDKDSTSADVAYCGSFRQLLG